MIDPLSEKTILQYKMLPDWAKGLMRYTPCYRDTESEVLGWELCVNSNGYGDEIPVNASVYFTAAIEGIFGVSDGDIKRSMLPDRTHFRFSVCVDGKEEEFIGGEGETRLEAAMDMFFNCYEYYMDFCRPSVTDMGNHLEDSFVDRDGEFSIEVTNDFFLNFNGLYSRFMVERNSESLRNARTEYCYGKIQLVEGIARVYKNYGVEEDSAANDIVLHPECYPPNAIIGGCDNVISAGEPVIFGDKNSMITGASGDFDIVAGHAIGVISSGYLGEVLLGDVNLDFGEGK